VGWRHDRFFMTRVPLVIGAKYGQNLPLSFSEENAAEFDDMMRWEDMKWVSFAIATEIE
jgi:hypothetical protein